MAISRSAARPTRTPRHPIPARRPDQHRGEAVRRARLRRRQPRRDRRGRRPPQGVALPSLSNQRSAVRGRARHGGRRAPGPVDRRPARRGRLRRAPRSTRRADHGLLRGSPLRRKPPEPRDAREHRVPARCGRRGDPDQPGGHDGVPRRRYGRRRIPPPGPAAPRPVDRGLARLLLRLGDRHGPIPRGMCSRPSSFANGRRPCSSKSALSAWSATLPHRPRAAPAASQPRESIQRRSGRAHVRGCGHARTPPCVSAALRGRLDVVSAAALEGRQGVRTWPRSDAAASATWRSSPARRSVGR